MNDRHQNTSSVLSHSIFIGPEEKKSDEQRIFYVVGAPIIPVCDAISFSPYGMKAVAWYERCRNFITRNKELTLTAKPPYSLCPIYPSDITQSFEEAIEPKESIRLLQTEQEAMDYALSLRKWYPVGPHYPAIFQVYYVGDEAELAESKLKKDTVIFRDYIDSRTQVGEAVIQYFDVSSKFVVPISGMLKIQDKEFGISYESALVVDGDRLKNLKK